MRKLIKLFSQHSSELKYILFVVVILAMIMSIRTYLNFVAIEDAIVDVEQESSDLQEEMAFVEKFHIKYLSSDYADYFLAHENNVLFPGEVIVRFDDVGPDVSDDNEEVLVNVLDQEEYTAKEAWIHFWSARIDAIH